jgi:phosphatidylglycerol lysyltransferase
LRSISDDWLAQKNTRELGFSLGYFDETYLRHFSTALLRLDGKLVAFANVLQGAGRHELSVDLMRYVADAPHGVMDCLFIELMLWGRREGFDWFDLGMAPLGGMPDRTLAPVWSRLGALAFRHGEHFYHFEGLRAFKDKFEPRWEPIYLASPGGLSVVAALTDIAGLVSGGLKAVVRP